MPPSFFLYWVGLLHVVMKKPRIYMGENCPVASRLIPLDSSVTCLSCVFMDSTLFFLFLLSMPELFQRRLEYFWLCDSSGQYYWHPGDWAWGKSKNTEQTKIEICKHDMLSVAGGTLAHVWGAVHLCHCFKTDWNTTMTPGRIAWPRLSLSLLSHAQTALESLI